ncbi:MAG: hypothetical protein IPP19_16500 [Verrucomicrobia bacterium]|nr:hypothetical protein [Verrucomicrobiota bacterium]
MAIDASHNLYVADTGNATVRKISAGTVTTLAGSVGVWGLADGTGSAASFGIILGTAVDASGNVYVADPIQRTIRKITPAGVVSTLSLDSAFPAVCDPTGVAVNSDGSIVYFTDRGNNLVRQRTADGAVTIVAGDNVAGNLYVVDTGNHTIRKVDTSGTVSTLAGLAGQTGTSDGTSAAAFDFPAATAVDTDGNGLCDRQQQ